MTKNVKIILGVIAGIVGVFVGYLTVTSVVSNISNNRQQEQVNLKVENTSNNKKNSKAKSDKNTNQSTKSSSNSDSKSDAPDKDSIAEAIKTPANSDYTYDENASRVDAVLDKVYDNDYYTKKVNELSRGLSFTNTLGDSEKTEFVNHWNEVASAINQFAEARKNSASSASPELNQLGDDITNKYFDGETNAVSLIMDAYSHFPLAVDNSTLKLATSGASGYAFEMILNGPDNQQYMYVNGIYNKESGKITKTRATYLKDGAVARDKVALSATSSQNTEHPN